MPRRPSDRRPRPPRAPTRMRSSTICASPRGVSERSITNSSAPARQVRSSARVRLGEELADRVKDLVARRVAALHVEVAEAVDVDDRDRQRAAVALGALDVELELGAERGEGHQAGDSASRPEARPSWASSSAIRSFALPGAQLRCVSLSLESTARVVSAANQRASLNRGTLRLSSRSAIGAKDSPAIRDGSLAQRCRVRSAQSVTQWPNSLPLDGILRKSHSS